MRGRFRINARSGSEFVRAYNERVPHITLRSIANNTEIHVIWERWQETLEPLRDDLLTKRQTLCRPTTVP